MQLNSWVGSILGHKLNVYNCGTVCCRYLLLTAWAE